MIAGLYAITSPGLMPGEQLLIKSEAALAAGCRWLQYRNKTAGFDQRLAEATQLKQLCDHYSAHLIINDNVEIARTVSAGVHLGREDSPLPNARTSLGAQAVVGATCHADLSLAKSAQLQGASYVAFGRFFPSQTKPQAPPADLNFLVQARKQLTLPVVAIGGINLDNAASVIEAGADAIAICHDIFALNSTSEIASRVQRYLDCFQ